MMKNGTVYVLSTIICNVMSSAAKAKIESLYLNAKIWYRHTEYVKRNGPSISGDAPKDRKLHSIRHSQQNYFSKRLQIHEHALLLGTKSG